jgi:hypothetical protein
MDNLQKEIDEGLHFAKDYLKSNLERNVLRITFTKVNGTTRVMDATLKPEYIGNYKRKYPYDYNVSVHDLCNGITENPENISVWSVADKDWRSLKVINITEIAIV